MLLKCKSFYYNKLINPDFTSTLIILILLCEEFECEVCFGLDRTVWIESSLGNGQRSV